MKKWLLRRLLWLVILGILFAIGQTAWAEWASHSTITLIVNDEPRQIRTKSHTVAELLAEQQIIIDPADILSPAPETRLEDDMVIELDKATQLVLDVDGEIQRIYTHALNPVIILQEQGITLAPTDVLLVNHLPFDPSKAGSVAETPRHLRVVHSKNFTVNDNGTIITAHSALTTVGEALYEQDLGFYLADVIEPAIDTPLTEGMQIQIVRSKPVLIKVDGSDLQTRAIGQTVGEVLNQLGLQLMGQDYSLPSEFDAFVENMTIQVVRVIEILEVEEKAIPFPTITIYDPNLAANESRLVQAGEAGLEETQIRVRQENNQITSRVVQYRWIARQPVPEIIAYGRRDKP